MALAEVVAILLPDTTVRARIVAEGVGMANWGTGFERPSASWRRRAWRLGEVRRRESERDGSERWTPKSERD